MNQSSYIFTPLLQLIEDNNESIDQIKNQYVNLLSYLTETNNISATDFITKASEIHTMGTIMVCYYIDNGPNGSNQINLIGSGTVIIEPKIIHSCKSVGHIEDIVVHPSYRSHGIAKNIINSLVEIAKSKNCYKVILDCKDDISIFYEKNGFENRGSQMAKYF